MFAGSRPGLANATGVEHDRYGPEGRIQINADKLAERLGIQVVAISARKNEGLEKLKTAIANTSKVCTQVANIDVNIFAPEAIKAIKAKLNTTNDYYALQVLHQHEHLTFFTPTEQQEIEEDEKGNDFESSKIQGAETIARYRYLSTILKDVVIDTGAAKKFKVTDKLELDIDQSFLGLLYFHRHFILHF